MQKNEIISIIIVSFNSSKTIQRTINSIRNQTYKEIQIVYVDGGSTDGTRELINRNAGENDVVIFEKDKGIYDAMNKGLFHATGKYKFILNSDDLYAEKNTLDEIIEIFRNNNEIDIVVGEIEYFLNDPLRKTGRIWKVGKYLRGNFLHGWHPPHPAFFSKKICYENNKFQIDLKIAADYELMLRLIHTQKYKVAYLNKTTTLMDAAGTSGKLKSRISALRDVIRALNRNDIRLMAPYVIIMRYIRKLFY
jgi:glycosyltransferase involved in cell wall biosynthesis